MSLRDTIHQHQRASVLLLIIFIGTTVAITWMVSVRGTSHAKLGPPSVFFMDLDDGSVFAADANRVGPVTPPGKSAATGVLLHVFACGSCRDKAQQFQAYLEGTTPEAQQAKDDMEDLAGDGSRETIARRKELQAQIIDGEQVAKAEKPYTWVTTASPEGQEIVQSAATRCAGKGPRSNAIRDVWWHCQLA